jgi:hypothetical protein
MTCCNGLGQRVRGRVNVVRGGVRGLVRAALGTEPPDSRVLAKRGSLCFGVSGQIGPCEKLGIGLVCKECGCLAMAKIRVASEACPLGKWGPEPPIGSNPSVDRPGPRLPVGPPQV